MHGKLSLGSDVNANGVQEPGAPVHQDGTMQKLPQERRQVYQTKRILWHTCFNNRGLLS